jgi:hypothetical protein
LTSGDSRPAGSGSRGLKHSGSHPAGPARTTPGQSLGRGRTGGRRERRRLDPGQLPRRRPHLHCGDDSSLISPAACVDGGDCLCSVVSAGSAIDRIPAVEAGVALERCLCFGQHRGRPASPATAPTADRELPGVEHDQGWSPPAVPREELGAQPTTQESRSEGGRSSSPSKRRRANDCGLPAMPEPDDGLVGCRGLQRLGAVQAAGHGHPVGPSGNGRVCTSVVAGPIHEAALRL